MKNAPSRAPVQHCSRRMKLNWIRLRSGIKIGSSCVQGVFSKRRTSRSVKLRMLRPSDGDQESFLGQDLSHPLTTMITSLAYVAELTYVVDFASVVFARRNAHKTAEAGKEPLRKRVKRVTGYFSRIFTLLVVTWKRRKSFTVARSGASTYLLFKNPAPYSSFVGNRQSFLEGVLSHLFLMPAGIPRQYQSP